jgi:hypothetical protein
MDIDFQFMFKNHMKFFANISTKFRGESTNAPPSASGVAQQESVIVSSFWMVGNPGVT